MATAEEHNYQPGTEGENLGADNRRRLQEMFAERIGGEPQEWEVPVYRVLSQLMAAVIDDHSLVVVTEAAEGRQVQVFDFAFGGLVWQQHDETDEGLDDAIAGGEMSDGQNPALYRIVTLPAASETRSSGA